MMDKSEVRRWRDDALEVSASIVARYVDCAGAKEVEGAIDDILALHSNPEAARSAITKARLPFHLTKDMDHE